MFAVLTVAVSLASAAPVTLDVPYLPQSALLCGGAAAGMVFRYWGDTHAGVQQFESLVDRHAGGIADDVLVRAIAERGWRIGQFAGSLELLDDHLTRGEPIIVLLAERGNRYHYVVVVGRTAWSVVIHDPAWGPNRQIEATEFLKRWDASQRWALSVRPAPANESQIGFKGDTTYQASADTVAGLGRTNGECEALVNRGIADVRERGLDAADDIF